MPSIRTLRTFLSVTRHGSLAAAARELGLTAAAVGLQIRRLEDDLERSLFDRSGRAVVLNPAGHALVACDLARLRHRRQRLPLRRGDVAPAVGRTVAA